MNLTFRENYWDSPGLRVEYNRYLSQLFSLDLSRWDEAGFWDNNYRPFSFFDNDRLVANVCVYSLDMVVQGVRQRAAQISAVGTLPEYRRRGLAAELMRRGLEWARGERDANTAHDFYFLFADEEAFSLYRACGFRPVNEYAARISLTSEISQTGVSRSPGLLRLDMERREDVDRVFRMARERMAVSDTLGVLNAKLLMFWCLYGLRDYIHYIPDLDVLVIFKRDGELVTIYDIVGTQLPTFAELFPYIGAETDEICDFRFVPDKLQVGEVAHVPVEGNGTHVMGTFPLDRIRFMFPFTAQA